MFSKIVKMFQINQIIEIIKQSLRISQKQFRLDIGKKCD